MEIGLQSPAISFLMGVMDASEKKLLVCDCAGTMALDGGALGKAFGQTVHVHHQLCRSELANVEAAAKAGAP